MFSLCLTKWGKTKADTLNNKRGGFYGLFRLLGMVGISVNGLILLIDAYIIYVIAQRELRIVGYATIASDGKIE